MMIDAGKVTNLFKVLVVLTLALGTTQVHAADGAISLAGKNAVIIRVTNIPNAQGVGIHFSSSSYTDGYGGYDAECHFIETSSLGLEVRCFDGYQDASNHVNEFRSPLGWKSDVLYVVFTVTKREVRVDVVRRSNNGFTTEEHAYTQTAVFPIRQSSGFWRSGTLYYKVNGNLANVSGRSGSGYQISSIVTH